MPIQITWEPEGLYCRCFGAVSAAEVFGHLNEIASTPGFEGFGYRITDALDVTDVSLGPDEVRWIAHTLEVLAFGNPRMLEVLVARDERHRALWRQLVSVSRNPHRFLHFASLADGRAWIEHHLDGGAHPLDRRQHLWVRDPAPSARPR